jgi:c(7)-type cytochrome triheme protein
MGLNCVECHKKIAHSGTLGYRSSMPICFTCHDAKRKEGKQPPADSNCTACHRNSDRVTPKKAIPFGSGEKQVNFNHTTHTKNMKCDACHTQRFPMQAGKTKLSFKDHGKNTACFSCHNGKQAPDWTNCTTCHTKMPKPKAVVFGKGATSVTFKHDTHTAKNQCTACHTGLFAMKAGSAKITLADHSNNKTCFSCHNGKKAGNWTNCTTCHSKAPRPSDIIYKPADVEPVTFSHAFHADNFECKDCHTKIWPMKRGAPMKMDSMYEGGLCGTCHSEKGGAFTAMDCNKCHKASNK